MDSTSPFQPYDSGKNVKAEKELVDDAKLQRENVNHPKHTQTASYDKESVVVESNEAGPSSAVATGPEPSWSQDSKMDPGKIASMQQIVENTLSQEGRLRVSQLLDAVESLSSAEKLLLYLRLPTGVPPHDPLKQPVNPLGSRAELQQTVTWIQTHLEVDPDVSLPKQDVYDEYIAHCMSNNMKPLSTADFGKVMKQVYPTVRPRRLGTRGNSRYCYAGLRKKIKLEVPQLPDLGESSKESPVASRETERIVCDWAETKLGVKIANISELSRHLMSMSAAPQLAPSGPVSVSPPPSHTHGPPDDAASRQLLKQLKRKIQTQGTPGRPKKNKPPEPAADPPASTSYLPPHSVKHEGPEYYPPYVPLYEPYPPYAPPHYRDRYVMEPPYPRDLTLPAQTDALPINLSSDASLDLSTERADWQRRRPPEPPPAAAPPRLPPLPGKKLILETYQSERRQPASPVTEYLPKKMRAAEILGGKLGGRHAPPDPSTSAAADFLDDPKNLTSRSKSTAAALAREEQEAASGARAAPPRGSPDCCGLDGISARTGMICQERHSEILNRERVISICNIDKHALDHYLNEGNSRDHEEELLHYFPRRAPPPAPPPRAPPPDDADAFLERGRDPLDDRAQGKNEKISQLRELLAKNLKNQSGPAATSLPDADQPQPPPDNSQLNPALDGAFKPVLGVAELTNGNAIPTQIQPNDQNHNNCTADENRSIQPHHTEKPNHVLTHVGGPHLYNGNGHTEPQSPTTRTQQYDFVPISDGCQSPGNFHSKSPLGFNQRSTSPTKVNKQVVMGGSLQTSPVSHSTAASPFVSPRNTPVPRSRMFSRPIPKLNGTGKKRRNPLSLGVADPCSKQFTPPCDQKFVPKTSLCGPIFRYSQPMSAPPSPNIISQYKNHVMFPCATSMPNGNVPHMAANFLPNHQFRETMNGDHGHPLSADPLSSEVSQFFQESLVNFRPGHDTSFRSQSVPLKQGINNVGLLSYNNTPVGSVPPTPVPNEFSDFDSLADTCDISKAGLNPETLDKIYDAIDSSNDVLNTSDTQSLLATSDTLTNGCDPRQQILTEDLNSLIPSSGELLDRNNQFNQTFTNDHTLGQNVEDFLQKVQRANSMEFDLTSLNDKSKYYTSRSVPSTPLPYKRTVSNLHIDPRRSRELFATETYTDLANGISSKSVPSTPQLTEERSVFSYSNRDFLINGNSVEACNSAQLHGTVDSDPGLTSPLHDMLREDILEPLERLTPAADLLADFDKIDGSPYGDL